MTIETAVAADDRDGRGGASQKSRCLLRRLTRHKIASRYRTLGTEGVPGPLEASDVRDDDGGGPCAVLDGAEAATMVQSYWTAF